MTELAQTDFFFISEPDSVERVQITLFEPVQQDETTAECRYRIERGSNSPSTRSAYGVDKWQALTYAAGSLLDLGHLGQPRAFASK